MAVLALLGATGFFAARAWMSSPAEEEDRLEGEAARLPSAAEAGEPPALRKTEGPATRKSDRPAEQTHVASLTSRRLDLPERPPSEPPSKGGEVEQPAEKVLPAPVKTKGARPQPRSQEELRGKLAWAPEVGLGTEGLTVFNAFLTYSAQSLQFEGLPRQTDPTPLLQVRPDLAGMPFQNGPNCQLRVTTANDLDGLSRKLRVYLTRITPVGLDGKRPKPAVLEDTLRRETRRGKKPEWLRKQAIPSLMQLLMHEDEPLRQMLVDLLADIPGPEATVALARRAVFDLAPEVRQSAVNALKKRDRQDYRPVLLKALRYPWAPAADHAAEALVALDDKASVPELVVMLNRPDPRAPLTLNTRHTVVQELVRANHFTNCLLCHPPSLGGNEPVIGIDPLVALPFTLASTTTVPAQATVPQLPRPAGPRVVTQVQSRTRTVKDPQGRPRPVSIPSSVLKQIQLTAQRVAAQSGCHDYGAAAASLFVTTRSIPARQPGGGTPPVAVTQTVVTRRRIPVTVPIFGQIPVTVPQTGLTFTSGAIPVLVRGDITYLRQDFSVQLLVSRPLPLRPLSVRFDYLVRAHRIPTAEAERLRQEFAARDTYPQRDAVLFALRELTGKDAGKSTAEWVKLYPGAEQDVEAARLTAQLLRAVSPLREQLLTRLRDGKGVEYTLALANAIPSLKGPFQEKARAVLVERLSRMTAKTLRDKLADEDPEVRRAAVQACQRKEKKELVPELIGLLADSDPLTARTADAALRDMTGQEHETAEDWKEWWEDQ